MERIACIVPIFNYAQDELLEQNHRQAVCELRTDPGVDVYTIRAHLLEPEGSPPLYETWLKSGSVLWQKEALINHAAAHLRHEYKILAWADSGISLSPGWAKRTRKSLQTHDAVQLFETGCWLNKHQHVASRRLGYVRWLIDGKPSTPDNTKASVGGAWAVRSDVFSHISLYDRQIVGGGDTWAICGLMGIETPEALVAKIISHRHRLHVQAWLQQVRAYKFSVGCIRGEYRHLWHTPQTKRYHGIRHQILVQEHYDPELHTTICGGLVRWTPAAPLSLRRRVENFILSRSSVTVSSGPAPPCSV